MRLANNVNWITARNQFQSFLHRKLHLDKPSIEIEGIVSNTDTWYIIKDSDGLVIKALRDMAGGKMKSDSDSDSNSNSLLPKSVVAIGAVAVFVICLAKLVR